MPSEQVYVVMCDHHGDMGEVTDVMGIYKSLESANHFVLNHLKEEYGEDFEYEEYEEDTSGETARVIASGWENDTFELYVVVKELLP